MFRLLKGAILLCAAGIAPAASAQDTASPLYDATTRVYTCADGTIVTAAYVNMPDGLSLAVVDTGIDMMVLEIAISASGARYVEDRGDERHVWWTKGDEAFLQRGPDGAEEMVLRDCIAEGP